MQFKKDNVKNSLLKSGEKKFLKKGFEGASLRKIVKDAGTTIGNFYNYFENKEALFIELVKDDYNKFMKLLNQHENIEKPDYLWNISNPKTWRNVLSKFMENIIPKFGNGIVLLLDSSKGTKYENSKNKLIENLELHLIDHAQRFGNDQINREFLNVLASQFIYGFVKILKDNKNNEKRHELIIEHFLFFVIGTMGMIGDFNEND